MEKAILERDRNFRSVDEGVIEGSGGRHRKTVEGRT
jgi:hypothetical protein